MMGRASTKKAQVMLEFVFCMIVLFLMMYAVIMIFRWVGLDLWERQHAHDALLTTTLDDNYGKCVAFDVNSVCTDYRAVENGPLSQVDPYFYTPAAMNAVWAGN